MKEDEDCGVSHEDHEEGIEDMRKRKKQFYRTLYKYYDT